MDDATLVPGVARPTVRFERRLRRSPSAVWRALTVREELESWFPCDVLVDEWKVGASLRFVFRAGEGPDLNGTVLEFDEPRILAFEWGDEVLRFELTEVDGGTRLVFTDQLDATFAARNAAGWDVCLELLDGRTAPEDLWTARFDRYVEAFEPAIGPQVGPPERP